jgi:hypothetical protein
MNTYVLTNDRFENLDTGSYYNWTLLKISNHPKETRYVAFKSYGGRGKNYVKDPIEFRSLPGAINYFHKVKVQKLNDGWDLHPQSTASFGSAPSLINAVNQVGDEISYDWTDVFEVCGKAIVEYVVKCELGSVSTCQVEVSIPEPESKGLKLEDLPAIIGSW